MNPILKVNNVSYAYENGEGIANVSFDVEKGDFLAIIGKSGAGKSTLIHAILGILTPSQGEVWIDDALSAKDISFSPQTQAIDWYLNVFDNVYMEALFNGSSQAKKETQDVLKDIGLAGKEKEDPTNLSGGQLQRVQLARQLVSNANILILDEPTASLDIVTTESILEKLKKKVQEGRTCLISSHDLDMLEKYCNKILFIEKGKLIFFGPITRFLDQYSNLNAYKIVYEEELPDKVVRLLEASFNVSQWQPLILEIPHTKSINEVLKILIANDVTIRSFEKHSQTLKEIISLKG